MLITVFKGNKNTEVNDSQVLKSVICRILYAASNPFQLMR
jgi:hypothetical protein